MVNHKMHTSLNMKYKRDTGRNEPLKRVKGRKQTTNANNIIPPNTVKFLIQNDNMFLMFMVPYILVMYMFD
jgi:hypothetical protein